MAWLTSLIITHASILVVTQAFVPPTACSFAPKRCHPPAERCTRKQIPTRGMMSTDSSETACSRANFLSKAVVTSGSVFGVCVVAETLSPDGAAAKSEEVELLPVNWKEEFTKVRTGSAELMKEMRKHASEENWPALMDISRSSDLSFRKAVMGKVRKKFPPEDKKLKEEGQSLFNAVSYDLIAVNKAARVADRARALEVCDILEGDINTFLELEKRVQ